MTTKAQKRVDLAKDVLAQLKAKKFKARCGAFCIKQFDYTVGTYEETCSVCAAGALMVACCGEDVWASESDVAACLTPLFSRKQIGLIEAAFEGQPDLGLNNWKSTPTAIRASKMFRANTKAPFRMRAIMKNLIDNNGTFVVPKS